MQLNDKQKKYLYPGLILSFTAISLITITTFAGPFMPLFLAHFFNAISIASQVFLIGIGHGIVNDVLATGHNIDYFSKGHQPDFRAINSEDRIANFFAWGIVATWPLCIPASALFGISALICNFFSLPELTIFTPAMVASAILILIAADIYARFKKNRNCSPRSH